MTKQPDLAHIPPQILDLIHKRNILSSEDPVLYDSLFNELLCLFTVVDSIQCLNLKRLHDIRWDILRISGFKPKIIDAARKDALQSLLQSVAYHGTTNVSGIDGSGKMLQIILKIQQRRKPSWPSWQTMNSTSIQSTPTHFFCDWGR